MVAPVKAAVAKNAAANVAENRDFQKTSVSASMTVTTNSSNVVDRLCRVVTKKNGMAANNAPFGLQSE